MFWSVSVTTFEPFTVLIGVVPFVRLGDVVVVVPAEPAVVGVNEVVLGDVTREVATSGDVEVIGGKTEIVGPDAVELDVARVSFGFTVLAVSVFAFAPHPTIVVAATMAKTRQATSRARPAGFRCEDTA